MNKEDIISKHKSICFSCENSRRPASDENAKKGYVGCSLRAKEKHHTLTGKNDHWAITEGKEVCEGWVDLKSRPFNSKSGIITNFQLLTYKIESCDEYYAR